MDDKYILDISDVDEKIEISDKGVKVYNSERVLHTIPVHDILAIMPIEETSICIYYITEKEPHPFTPNKLVYKLDRLKMTPLKLCHALVDKFTNLEILQSNMVGLAYIRSDERIVEVRHNVSLNDNNGILYITDLRIIHETENGISMNMYHEQIQHVKEVGRKTIRIIWEHDVSSLYDPIFSSDLIMSDQTEQEDGHLEITMGFARLYDFDDKFFSLNESPVQSVVSDIFLQDEYHEQLDYHLSCMCKMDFGHLCPEFTGKEKGLELACVLEGDHDAEWIASMTDEEIQQRIFATRFGRLYDNIIHETGMHKHLHIPIEHHKKDTRIKFHRRQSRQSDRDIIRHVNRIRAESLRYYDKRVMMVYKRWCEKNPLQDFTDEYNDGWFKYLVKELNPYYCKDCGARFRNHSSKSDVYTPDSDANNNREYKIMLETLANRDRNHTIIANFVAPDYIEQQHIYNNCWYDAKRKMWYVQNDNLIDILQSIADSDQEQSESVIGRRVWGFKEERVEMFCGFPSIRYKGIYSTTPVEITTSRVTGQVIHRMSPETINYILPILRESDITSEIAIRRSSTYYDTDALNYVSDSSGRTIMTTPKMAKFRNERYEYADIPLNERIRRVVFTAETGLTFNPQAPQGPYTIQVPETYPDTLYDERFKAANVS